MIKFSLLEIITKTLEFNQAFEEELGKIQGNISENYAKVFTSEEKVAAQREFESLTKLTRKTEELIDQFHNLHTEFKKATDTR